MSATDKFLADIIVIGILCGVYLQYSGFQTLKAVPYSVDRSHRTLTRDGVWKLVESLAYTFLGAGFELLCISKAAFS